MVVYRTLESTFQIIALEVTLEILRLQATSVNIFNLRKVKEDDLIIFL